MQRSITVHSSLLIGDLIYALPGFRQIYLQTGSKTTIFLSVNATWPMMDAVMRRNGVTMTQEDFDAIRPLLLSQEYIDDVVVYNGEPIMVNLDDIMKRSINVPYGYLPRWYFYVWPDLACNLSERWIQLDERVRLLHKGVILVNRSSRYHNPQISYKFLEKYKDRVIFIGLDDEWKSFCSNFFEVRHYKVKDFYELAVLINSCKFFVGNQSFCFSLAEALKVPRILELFATLPNVIPHGNHAYDFYRQEAFEFYVEKLMKS